MAKNIMKYSLKHAFFNRQSELDYLREWINQEPNEILFIYGPKSSGKTTLLMKFIDMHLNNKHYNIKHFNLREMLISNYIDFIQAFFEIDYSKDSPEIKQKTQYSLKVFRLSREIKKSLENRTLDPFHVMKKELIKISKKGKQAVIIIDELQALEDIYLNGQRELLKELFNFFVAMTKEAHLCHVIIASSDGYFMKRIYEDSKLAKTSTFFLVDYLNEKDTKYWLNNLESESAITRFRLTTSQIDLIWKYFGGSMWEITNLLGELLRCSKKNSFSNDEIHEVINDKIDGNCSRFYHYAGTSNNRIVLLKEIFGLTQQKKFFRTIDLKSLTLDNLYDDSTLSEALNRLVQMNYLAFNPINATYQLQGKSMFFALKKFVESIQV